jgi:hypothetical protein
VEDTAWQVAGAADFNGDRRADLVWRNQGTSQNVVRYLNGATFLGQAPLPAVPDTNRTVMRNRF